MAPVLVSIFINIQFQECIHLSTISKDLSPTSTLKKWIQKMEGFMYKGVNKNRHSLISEPTKIYKTYAIPTRPAELGKKKKHCLESHGKLRWDSSSPTKKLGTSSHHGQQQLCPRVCRKSSHKLSTAIVRACLWVCSDEKGFGETRRPTIPVGSPFWREKKHYKNLDEFKLIS